ncbi:hypothetical protein OD507_005084 [Salmonella enterica]|nr:hypothetical protein [Salmonella enterica]EJU2684381.1 hypothetical protein [Salmonella enterica]EJX3842456.1 hypothetical protein [Salmonella enterica]EJX4248525.1 hypothetical protein [Salmonella enterica]EJX4537264.1 hypothetical protein [Salmonella enterica]
MITEITALISALKEAMQLADILKKVKTTTEVNSVISDLNSKLTSAQCECVSLIKIVSTYQEETAMLKAKIAEFENFESDVAGYSLDQLDSGALVYSKKHIMGDTEITVYLCPQCYTKRIVSILQPTGDAAYDGHTRKYFYQSRCHCCDSLYPMNYSDYQPPSVNFGVSWG